MKNKIFKSSLAGPLAASLLLAAAIPASAAIVLVNTGSQIIATPTNSTTFSYDAGAANKLIVTVGAEGGVAASAVISYNGVALTLAPDTSSGRAVGIWYLDNPFTGGDADLVVDFTASGANGLGVGVASISGAALGVDVTAAGAAGNQESISQTVTPTLAGSFGIVNYADNGGGAQTAPSALTGIYGFSNIGSAFGYAGYEENVAATAQTYTFPIDVNSPAMGVAVFSPIPEPSSVALIGLFGGLALLRRRK